MIREIKENELDALLELYLHLHETEKPEQSEQLVAAWEAITKDANHHIIVKEFEGKLVSSCVCVIIPNLTRGGRPYAFIENVVTHEAYRGRGFATECLDYARELAKKQNCYKMMLLTGSRKEATHRFYQNAGYNGGEKTAYVQWLGMR